MKDLRLLDDFRDAAWEREIAGSAEFDRACAGAFVVPSPIDGKPLRCMASAARGTPFPWDHVSISRAERTPSWAEMDAIFTLFFEPDEVAVQFHVPSTDHVNHHPNCLHLWAYHGLIPIPRPPSWMIGPDKAKGRKGAANGVQLHG